MIPFRKGLLVGGVAAAWCAALALLGAAGLSDFLEHRVVRAVEFRAREWLGRTPPLDPRLKAYALDDSTAAMLGGTRLTPDDWIRTLSTLKARKPRAILIDALFSTDADVTDEQAEALAALAEGGSRIAAGALLTPGTIKYRSPLPPEAFDPIWNERLRDVHVQAMPGAKAYGAAPKYRRAFNLVGHIMQPWPARFAPAIRIDGGVIPHISAYAAETRSPVPVDADGLAPIDFLSPGLAAKSVRSLRHLIDAGRAGTPITQVDEGDVVLLIHNYSTGNTDVLDSPFGPIPGGYIIMALVNATLRNHWLAQPLPELPAIALFAVVGALLGALSTTAGFWVGALLASVLTLTGAIATFTFASAVVPWLFPLVALLGAGLTSFGVQRWRESKRRMQLEMEMATASALQQHFFPPPETSHPRFELAAHYHPADAVGGDWYAYYVVNDTELHLHLGDVTGHGTSAALLASFAKGAADMIYQQHAALGASAPDLVTLHSNLNELLRARSHDFAYMTLWSMTIDLTNGEARYLNSGHRPALVADGEKRARSLDRLSGSSILGHEPLTADIVTVSCKIAMGETLLVMSDGLLDVPQSFGVKAQERHVRKLLNHIHQRPGTHAKGVRAALIEELELGAHPGRAYIDDVTFMVVRLKDVA